MSTKTHELDVLATNKECARLCHQVVSALKAQNIVHVAAGSSWDSSPWGSLRKDCQTPLLIVCRLADIGSPAALGDRPNRTLVFMDEMPPEATSRLTRLRIKDERRLHVAQTREPQRRGIIKRIIGGYLDDESKPIVDAWWEDGQNFVVISPEYDRLEVPLVKLQKFIGDDKKKLSSFEVDDDGAFVYWEHADAHFGWEDLECLVDPAKVAAAKVRTATFTKEYGARIRNFREFSELRQSDISGIDPRHLRRVESGEVFPTRRSLAALARAHKLTLEDYLAHVSWQTI